MQLAVSGLRVIQNQVRQWGAQELVIGMGKAKVLVAGLGVKFGTKAVQEDGSGVGEGRGQEVGVF